MTGKSRRREGGRGLKHHYTSVAGAESAEEGAEGTLKDRRMDKSLASGG